MNAVTELARAILRLRGQSTETCTVDQLKSAYDKAEWMTEALLRIAQRVQRRREREAA